ncbi:transcription initiation factor IID, 31kD subunit-domain-containing protein [Biscogniauxia mediterranea]|nr:transcription initiation factor IID, 31kD subunit-domain-containing protein [Biscogniauxia mediterranea]
MASTSSGQANGVPPSSAAGPSQPASQPTQNTATSGSSTVPNTQSTTGGGASSAPAPAAATSAPTAATAAAPSSPTSPATTTHAPRPRDARTIELLLTSQGVTSFDSRVPLLLLDFAYRHTSSILSDALHLSTDPYTTQAGAKPSASSGAAPTAPSNSDAVVTTNAVNLAIASRQAYQFRGGIGGGGGGGGGGGTSKDWLQELARERNKIALPRVLANEWGVRLPNERFVLSGMGWGLRDQWAQDGADSDEDDEDGDGDGEGGAGDSMEGLETSGGPKIKNEAGEGGDEGGGLDELLGDDIGDEDMDGME